MSSTQLPRRDNQMFAIFNESHADWKNDMNDY